MRPRRSPGDACSHNHGGGGSAGDNGRRDSRSMTSRRFRWGQLES